MKLNSKNEVNNNKESNVVKKKMGELKPMKAQQHIRVTCRFDYAPGICKDYKETGYCGFGDSCVFLHDRSDYKIGWELERDWIKMQQQKQKKKEHSNEEEESNDDDYEHSSHDDNEEHQHELSSKCGICGNELVEPIVTLCEHYFCEKCAIDQYKKTNKCKICGKNTKGVFNSAENVIKRIQNNKKKVSEINVVNIKRNRKKRIIENKDNEIKELKECIGEQHDKVEKCNSKIKRLEEEVQDKFDENDRLKQEIEGLRKVNEELARKLQGISEFFK
jgi:ribosomal protein L34E